jgi:hypothetical protein
MAMTIKGLHDKIKSVNVGEVIESSMEDAAPLIADRQKDQMRDGVNQKGAKIGRYRNPAYARKKNAMNPLPGFGVPDLLLTGAFYKGIYADVRGDKLILDSTDGKTPKLAKQYGEEIFGLNRSTKAEFIREDLRPVFMKRIKKATGL